jgi:sugar lactone lactonase YvrE
LLSLAHAAKLGGPSLIDLRGRNEMRTLGLLVAITLALGACGGGKPAGGDGAAGSDGGTTDDLIRRDGRAGRDGTGSAGTGMAGTGAAGQAGTGAAGEGNDDGGQNEDGDAADAPYVPEIPPAMCPEDDGGAHPDAAGEVPSGPDDVMFVPNVTVGTVAGMGTHGFMNGTAAEATFSNPVSIAFDPITSDLVVCDFENDAIRRLTDPMGTVVVSTLTMQMGFTRPYGIAVDDAGNVYVDTDFNPQGGKNIATGTIWKVDTATGMAMPIAENIGRPRGLAARPDGKLVLGDYQNARVRLLDPLTGDVTDLAGLYGCKGMVDGKGKEARFDIPYGVTVLPDGKVIVADETNHRLRQVATDGTVTTFAGDGGDGTVDGPRLKSRFSHPTALTVDFFGNVFVADYGATRIRRIGLDGQVRTVAGTGTRGFKDGTGAEAQFYGIEGIAAARDGKTIYVADGSLGEGDTSPYNRVRVITIGP